MFSGIGGFEHGLLAAYRAQNSRSEEGTQQEYEAGERLESSEGEGVGSPYGRPGQYSNGGSDEGATCVGYSEIDKYATAIYTLQYPNHINYGDANDINTATLPDFELLVGGFPCQAFSIAGKRAGFNDTRGTLFFEIARVLAEKRPRYFVLENVKGLLSPDKGQTFQTILGVLSNIGYGMQWQVLNSKDFGVPQNRERVFIVGHIRGERRPEVFPIGEGDGNAGEGGGEPEGRVLNAIDSPYYKGADGKRPMIAVGVNRPSRGYEPRKDGVSCTIKAGESGSKNLICHTNKSGTMTDHNEAMALRSGASHNYQSVNRIRRLTPVECEKLQGFPHGWTKYGMFDGEVKEISDTQRYKCIGNAVTTTVVQAIMESLLKVLAVLHPHPIVEIS